MTNRNLKIGEVARRAGVSVRTLHHYDEIGLLRPAFGGGGSGAQREYGPDEIARLQAICSLKSLGLSLDDVARALAEPGFSPLVTIERQLANLDEELDLARRLRDRLTGIAQSLRSMETPSVDDLLETMEAMAMIENYYTPEQREQLAQRANTVGADRMETGLERCA